jgi:anti-sigma regulatory factor (Ser/Thr protein kinase)
MSRGGARIAISYDAHAPSVGAARRAVSSFAARHGASDSELDGVRLAVSEAVTNAVVHAYPSGDTGLIHVTAALTGRQLSVTVADDGCGFDGSHGSPGLGFGLNLIEDTCAALTVTAARSGGTRVQMRFLLSGAPTGEAAAIEPLSRRRVASMRPLRLAGYFSDGAAEASP